LKLDTVFQVPKEQGLVRHEAGLDAVNRDDGKAVALWKRGYCRVDGSALLHVVASKLLSRRA